MKKQPLNYSIKFDGKPITADEQRDAFLSLVKCLLDFSAQKLVKETKFSSQKERQEYQIFVNNYYRRFYELLLQKMRKTSSKADTDLISGCIRD